VYVVVGLGNPGSRYAGNRHNVGRMVLDRFADRIGADLGQTRFKSRSASADRAGEKVLLLEPETYMNLSGEAVWPAVRFFKLTAQEVVVVHDDVDLPLGRLQVKVGGGDGGHHGIQSIAQSLGTPDFVRLRVGVGRPAPAGDVSDYVLSNFCSDEAPMLEQVLAEGAAVLDSVVRVGPVKAANRCNRWRAPILAEREAGKRAAEEARKAAQRESKDRPDDPAPAGEGQPAGA
jgi:peptidyl-tRNA hydrolase, PTH1 family